MRIENHMTLEQAIRILDPETSTETLAEIEYYGGFRWKEIAAKALTEASELACEIMREHQQFADPPRGRWIPDRKGDGYICSICQHGVKCKVSMKKNPDIEMEIGQEDIKFCPICGTMMKVLKDNEAETEVPHECAYCAHFEGYDGTPCDYDTPCKKWDCRDKNMWAWRGTKKDEAIQNHLRGPAVDGTW